jgi:O-succinylbenzoate synthase
MSMRFLTEIKQICYAKYELLPKVTSLNAKFQNKTRHGALLRVCFHNSSIGYADCAPLVELGDLSLDRQLMLLSENKVTPLTQKSILFAKLDSQFRSQKVSAFENSKNIRNHFMISLENASTYNFDKIKLMGFSFLKIKCGINLKLEIDFIKNNYSKLKNMKLKLRLDFNCSLFVNQVYNFFEEIKTYLDIIDFVEDPCVFCVDDWEKIQNYFLLNLALDRKTRDDTDMSFLKTIIFKPAIDNVNYNLLDIPNQRIVFTSYMDHPLGQLCALYEAQQFYKKYPDKDENCGFLTHHLFEKNEYSEFLSIENTMLIAKLGTGFGFDEMLKNEKWTSIKNVSE